jgi:DNA-binding HxlR family transcriptional regulator
MERTSFADMLCSVAQCTDVVGDSWTMLIIRDSFAGLTRFDDFRNDLGIPRNTLIDRLTKLVDSGVLEKLPYSAHPNRHGYHLTDKGRDLWPVLLAMRQWGARHGDPTRPPIRGTHKDCGGFANVTVGCETCGSHLTPKDVELSVITAPNGAPVDPKWIAQLERQ